MLQSGMPQGQRLLAASPQIQFTPGIATSSRGTEQVHVEFRLKDDEVKLCENRQASDLGVLVALTGEEPVASKAEEAAPNKPIDHSYVMTLPSACSRRVYQTIDNRSIPLMQLRVNFGRVLDVFPELVRGGGPDSRHDLLASFLHCRREWIEGFTSFLSLKH